MEEFKPKNTKLKHTIAFIVVLVLIGLGVYGGYFYKSKITASEKQDLQNQIEQSKNQEKPAEATKSGKEYINNELGFSFNYPRNLILEEQEWYSDMQSQTVVMKLPGEKIDLEGSLEFPSFSINVYNNTPVFLKAYNAESIDSYFSNNPMIPKCSEKEINDISWKECEELGMAGYRAFYAQDDNKIFKFISMDTDTATSKSLNDYMDQVINTFKLIK